MKVNWKKEEENLRKLISDGTPYEKIGKLYDVTGNAVKKAAKKLGIELQQKRSINEKEHFNKGVSFGGAKSYYDECPICGKRKYHTSDLCSETKRKETILKNKLLGITLMGKNILLQNVTT